MSEPISWIYDAPTGKLLVELKDGLYRLSGEFQGETHELGVGPDLNALVTSLASSPNASQPFMENIKTLKAIGEAQGWNLRQMAFHQ